MTRKKGLVFVSQGGGGTGTSATLVRVSTRFQSGSALAQWYRARTDGPKGARKTTMIVALARKLLIALWRMVTIGDIPVGVALRPTT